MRRGLVVIQSDTHLPDNHVRATRSFLNFLNDVQPECVIQLGDLFDFLSVARWSTGTLAEDGRKLQQEIHAGTRFFASMREAYDGPYKWLPGNHEDRLKHYLTTKAQGLLGVDAINVPDLFHFGKYDVEVVEQPYAVAPGVRVIHGVKLGSKAGMSVHKEVERHNSSIVMGHCHRLAVVWRTTDKARFGVEAGHLMDQKKAGYLGHGRVADWQMGFAALYVDGQDVTPVVVPVNDKGVFWFEGKRFTP